MPRIRSSNNRNFRSLYCLLRPLRHDIVDIYLAHAIINTVAKEFALNRCPFSPGQMMTPDKDAIVAESYPRQIIPRK